MAIRFLELHAARTAAALNDEWCVVANDGPGDFIAHGCRINVGRQKGTTSRGSVVGTLDPGFVLHPGERVRLVTGSPGKKSHGPAPDETADCKTYHLFLGGALLAGGAGTVVRLVLNQIEMAKATYDPKAKAGMANDPT
jgi:hypothetical protein